MEKGGEEIPPTSNGHEEESSKDPQEGETKADASDELQETAKNINIITGEDKGRNTVPLYRDCGTNEKDRGSGKNAKVNECEKTATPRGHDLHKSCENISGINQNLSKMENITFEERNDEEKRNIFSQVNYLKFRDNLYEVIEELRIRRSTDSENEERIKQLVTEKHELERKLETETASNKTLSDQHEQEIIDAKKHSEDKMHQLEDDKQKLTLLVERTEKEVTGLKNEIRTLMLSKYSLEKKIKEKDHVIQMQSTAKDKHVIQIVDLEQKTKDVSNQVTGVTEQMERLEENVQAACKLNKKLAYINKHKHCELENCRKDLESSVQQLKKLRIELNRKPNDMARKLQEREKQVENLQQQVDQKALEDDQLKTQLEMSKAENLKILKSMEEAHELVSRHADSSRNNAELAAQLQVELTSVRENSEKMKSVCDEKQSELNKLATRHQEMEQTWQEKEKSLQKRLQVLQGDYEALSKSHTSVEELNTNWAEKNTTLIEEIKMLKERLDQKEGEEHKLKLDNERKLLMLQEQLDASMRQVASLQQEVHQWKSRERSNIETEKSREKTDCVEGCEADVFIEEEFFSPPTSPEEQCVTEEKATIEENSSSQTASSTVKTPERMQTVHKSEERENTDCASEMVVSKRRLDEVNNTGGDEMDGVPGAKKRKQDNIPETDGGNLKHTRKEHLLLPDSESHKSKEGRLDDAGSLRSIRGRCGPSEISKLMTCDISEQIALSSSQEQCKSDEKSKKRVSFSRKPTIFSWESQSKSPCISSVVPPGILKATEKKEDSRDFADKRMDIEQEHGKRDAACGISVTSSDHTVSEQKPETSSRSKESVPSKKGTSMNTDCTINETSLSNADNTLVSSASSNPAKNATTGQSPSRIIPALCNLSVSAASPSGCINPLKTSATDGRLDQSQNVLSSSQMGAGVLFGSQTVGPHISQSVSVQASCRSGTVLGDNQESCRESHTDSTNSTTAEAETTAYSDATLISTVITNKASQHATAQTCSTSNKTEISQSQPTESGTRHQLSPGNNKTQNSAKTSPSRFKYQFVSMSSFKRSRRNITSNFLSSSQPTSSVSHDGSRASERSNTEFNSEPLLKPTGTRKRKSVDIQSPCSPLFSDEDEDEENIRSEIKSDISRIQDFLKNERLSTSRQRQSKKEKV